MANSELEKNLEYVEKQRGDLLKKYAGKYLLVASQQVIGSFDDYEQAANEGLRQCVLETPFLVHFMNQEEQPCLVLSALPSHVG